MTAEVRHRIRTEPNSEDKLKMSSVVGRDRCAGRRHLIGNCCGRPRAGGSASHRDQYASEALECFDLAALKQEARMILTCDTQSLSVHLSPYLSTIATDSGTL
jgi:hypothetical protein